MYIAAAGMVKFMHGDFVSYCQRNGCDLPELTQEPGAILSAENPA